MYWGDGPIGLIWSSWGGTQVEAWAPATVLKKCPSSSTIGTNATALISADNATSTHVVSAFETAVSSAKGIDPHTNSVLYNGMIHPLTKCAAA